ncbi:prostaglandin E2 receptor EP2 subtype [Copidosoma floridanum]|uniref:prostaglandin E2 receptor EP2 subtype n=1 Tax=Copidosoma floridanum TaxID=29053 RepID=UPI0006C9D8DE|nr:prostaglandin E2 receptor EP2 subtype [Copidosoma floridanum]
MKEISGEMKEKETISTKKKLSVCQFIILTFVCAIGIVGNISALIILLHKDKRRNRKHLLMLRCLTINDLIAMLGTWVQMYVSRYWQGHYNLCALHVVWRLFGLFSGCVAIVMAAERWLALTRPFAYQKQVTYPMIVRCMVLLWLVALTLTFLPFVGFGVYQEMTNEGLVCVRYRDAHEPIDVAYAYVWFFFGSVLCLSIVWCNLAVARALKRLGRRNGSLRRISRASSRAKPLLNVAQPPAEVGITAEERAFAKLMALLSISFLICWMPQMISIPLGQYKKNTPGLKLVASKLIAGFQKVADVLLCLHFSLDPYIYVLLRVPRPRFPLLKPICRFCWPVRSRASSFTGTTEHPGSSGDPPTPITEAPSTPVSEEHEPQMVAVAV